ncbi:hypothetical protein ACFVYJ_00590 [Pontibacter sp. JAM-7]|uniref:hypothetical protein n=1 Tax=Pontibacter sp. JAM-7 TaxID=3366581 RepID=UPI003AF5AC77
MTGHDGIDKTDSGLRQLGEKNRPGQSDDGAIFVACTQKSSALLSGWVRQFNGSGAGVHNPVILIRECISFYHGSPEAVGCWSTTFSTLIQRVQCQVLV